MCLGLKYCLPKHLSVFLCHLSASWPGGLNLGEPSAHWVPPPASASSCSSLGLSGLCVILAFRERGRLSALLAWQSTGVHCNLTEFIFLFSVKAQTLDSACWASHLPPCPLSHIHFIKLSSYTPSTSSSPRSVPWAADGVNTT